MLTQETMRLRAERMLRAVQDRQLFQCGSSPVLQRQLLAQRTLRTFPGGKSSGEDDAQDFRVHLPQRVLSRQAC